jgi:3-hydroxyisobutyrate dehydrogenase
MTFSKILSLPSSPRLGWIGTGVMGAAMCGHFLGKSYPVTVYSRTRQKAEALLAQGAQWAPSPSEVVRQADVVFTMVGFSKDVREVYCGESGLLQSLPPNMVLVDMTTSLPSLAVELSETCRARRGYFVDAPVSGGDVGAQNATLSIMVGGEAEVVLSLRPLFEILGQTIIHQGPAGSGQHAKLCNQITIAGTMIGVYESLLYGYRAGLDLDTLLASIRGGAAACWTLDHLAPRILARNFDPGFLSSIL